MNKEDELDKYSHRLSLRNNICYENAQEIMKNSLKNVFFDFVNTKNSSKTCFLIL